MSSWKWLAQPGSYNARVRTQARGQHGVYAVRDKQTREVLYVGESHTGRLWKTMLRHFQGQQSFANIGEWTHPDPERVQVQLWITTTGDEAQKLELEKVESMAPFQVRGGIPEEEEVPF